MPYYLNKAIISQSETHRSTRAVNCLGVNDKKSIKVIILYSTPHQNWFFFFFISSQHISSCHKGGIGQICL